ncbi:MAG: class I SAM-dependent methyltransferase [Verrucomicrobiota bacterium]|nr:class I SAM-dependent methyltransferase [Verrucomicrobiota bacterium]
MANPLRQLLRPMSAADYTLQLVADGGIETALDIGCGTSSHLKQLRHGVETTGLDAHADAIDLARERGVHDHYIQANILNDDIDEQFDLVTLYGLIEHLPKSDGLRLLDRVEKLSCKYILLETPQGFVPQGPEFGNEFQRHHSGWFIQEFEGRGYTVHGTTGTRHLRGYMAGPKYNFPGCLLCDELLTLLLRINRKPKHAFNLVAIKDVRGIPARHGKEAKP